MNEERITETALQDEVLRGQVMKTPDDVEEMLRLKACGWGLKRIARELGCSHHTVKAYIEAGGVKPFKPPVRAKKLDGATIGCASGSSAIAATPTWCARNCSPRRASRSVRARCNGLCSRIGRP